MYSLKQSKRARGAGGEPLPTVYQALEDKGLRFLRGQLVLTAAGPGTGKSAFVLNLALKARVPTFYFSADSDAFTQQTRSIAVLKGCTLAQAGHAVLSGDMSEVDPYLEDVPLWFNFDASPSLDTIELQLAGYLERFEEFPHLIVVDNVTNVRGASTEDDPFTGLESLMDYLHDMARRTGACVVALHHVTGQFNDAEKAIPLSGVKGQITRVPEMVLTIHKRANEYGNDTLCVSGVKNRAGRADPSGHTVCELEFIGDRMTIQDAFGMDEQPFEFEQPVQPEARKPIDVFNL